MPRASSKNMTKEDENKFDVSGAELEGVREGNVPVFDTCDDVRTKIEGHLRKNNVTQAAFARAIAACQGEDGTPIQGKQITDFCHKGKRGPMSGNTSKACYASYVYFEKLRIKEGKKKSKKREDMEREYGANGVDRVRVSENVGVWCRGDERPYVNSVEKLEIGQKDTQSIFVISTHRAGPVLALPSIFAKCMTIMIYWNGRAWGQGRKDTFLYQVQNTGFST